MKKPDIKHFIFQEKSTFQSTLESGFFFNYFLIIFFRAPNFER